MTTTIPPLAIGSPAPATSALDFNGADVQLSTFWSPHQRGAAVVFLRHFGCIFCREHAVRLRTSYAEFTSRDLGLVTIGLGTPEQARGFAEWLKLPFPVLAAPSTDIYATWGLGRATAGDMVNLSVIKAGVRALGQRAYPGRPTGDPKQLPGSFLVRHDGTLAWAHLATHPGDLAPVDALLAASDAITAGR